jgi:hypothetical protein
VAGIAESIEETERLIIKEIDNGLTLKEARKKTGYHHLQTQDKKGD